MILRYFNVCVLICACIIKTQAQTPQKMSYQAVIRTADNQLVQNRTVRMRISLLSDSMNATPSNVYIPQKIKNI
jgi:hypothetical protein